MLRTLPEVNVRKSTFGLTIDVHNSRIPQLFDNLPCEKFSIIVSLETGGTPQADELLRYINGQFLPRTFSEVGGLISPPSSFESHVAGRSSRRAQTI